MVMQLTTTFIHFADMILGEIVPCRRRRIAGFRPSDGHRSTLPMAAGRFGAFLMTARV
jgi:hypothetical protein